MNATRDGRYVFVNTSCTMGGMYYVNAGCMMGGMYLRMHDGRYVCECRLHDGRYVLANT